MINYICLSLQKKLDYLTTWSNRYAIKKNKKLRHFADSIPLIVFISNKRGKLEYLNKNLYEYTALSLDTPFENILVITFHPEDYLVINKEWKKCVKDGHNLSIECRLKDAANNYRWHLIKSVLDKNAGGKINKWIGTCTDIHDLKVTREALKINEQKFEHLANNIPQHSWISDESGWIIWCNEKLVEYTGLPIEQMRTRDWKNIHHPDHVDRVTESFKKKKIAASQWEDIYPIRRSDGVFRWFLSRATPIKDIDGKVINWFGTSTDIDGQIKIEEMFNESEKKFKQLANSIPHIIWTSRADGYLDFYNDRFYSFTGIVEDKIIEQCWKNIVHPDDYKRQLIAWNESLESGDAYQYEIRLKEHSSGSYRWFLELALPVKGSNGEIIKWFGSCTDIDKQKQLSKQIEFQKAELESALIARDDFLTIASHELKTPLTSLKLYAQLFNRKISQGLEDAYSEDKIKLFSLRVEKQVSKLNRIVDDMLDVSRIQSGNLSLQLEEFDLCILATEVIESLENQCLSANTPLPICISNQNVRLIKGDRERIEQVLINLLTNSIRYGNGKQACLSISSNETQIQLILKDQGIGIAKHSLEKIFIRYEKIKNEKEVSGLGLGLYISKHIIEAHGGIIWVESELEVGSEFKINLPIK